MKIVVLDGYSLNPGDLDDTKLQQLGEVVSFDRTPLECIVERAIDADIVLTNKTPLSAATLAQLPKLTYIGVLATGTNVVDVAQAKDCGITVTNVPGYGPDAVAQMVFAHILHHTQRLSEHNAAVKEGTWVNARDFCFTLAPLQSLKHKTIGLIGFGDIGQQVARIALAFDMKVLVHTRTPLTGLAEGINWCELASLFHQADIISLHCPLTPATDKLINRESLSWMKKGALLINTARGGLVDEAALAEALAQGQLFAGVDVLSSEPPLADNPLLTAPNISISPHNAWATLEARQNLLDIATLNLEAFVAGQARNCV